MVIISSQAPNEEKDAILNVTVIAILSFNLDQLMRNLSAAIIAA